MHECGTRPFFRWVQLQGCGPEASGSSKNASGPVSIPLKNVSQVPGNKPKSLQRGLKPRGTASLRLEEINPPARMPDSLLKKPLNDVGVNQAIFDERPTRQTSAAKCLFFRWVWAQDRGPDASGGSKNASVPVGILLKRGASGAR